MKKQISFTDKDKELIEKIESYRKENDINHFIDAVRKLCCAGLSKSVNLKIDMK